MQVVGWKGNASRWLTALAVVLIFVICLTGKIHNTIADPQGTLLVSQSIVQHGTIKLDAYRQYLPRYHDKVYEKNQHFYYYFPLGSSIFSLPVVALANTLGFDMLDFENETQMAIVAMVSIATFLMLLAFARLYLPPARSLFAATAFWFGTAFCSTGATGLWSHDFAALFALTAFYLLFRENFLQDRTRFLAIGFLLFSAYFCRPTFLLLAAVFFPAALLFRRALAFWSGLSFLIFLALFSGFSLLEYQQLLPDYYQPSRLVGHEFWTALYGNLASPARGFFVYTPFMLLPLLWVIGGGVRKENLKLEFVLLIWPLLHLCAISRFPHWWAGYSFGPRLMLDVLPALYLWFVLYLRNLGNLNNWREMTRAHWAHWSLLSVAIVFSVVVNAYQGIFNKATANWNGQPSIDRFPEYLFDWRYPQFLHSRARQEARLADHNKKVAAENFRDR